MPVLRKRLARLALVFILFLMLVCSAFFLSTNQTAKATLIDLGYPWAAALTVPGGIYEWGYTKCPSNAITCMN